MTEAVAASDVVAVGKVLSVSRGREWVAAPAVIDEAGMASVAMARFANVEFRIDRLLSGTWSSQSIQIEFQVLRWDQVDQLAKAIPADTAVLFLHLKTGELDEGHVRLISNSQGIIASHDGVAEAPGIEGPSDELDEYLRAIWGLPFEQVVEEIAAIQP